MNLASLYSLAFTTSAVISLSVSMAAWRRRAAPGAIGLAILCAGQSFWSAVYALQWMFTDHTPSATWLLLRLTGLQITPTAILILVLGFTGRTTWLTRRNMVLLSIEPIATFFIALTDPFHGLYLGGQPAAIRVLSGGPAWWINTGYSLAIISLAMALLLLHLMRPNPYRLQTTVVFIAVALPVLHYVIQVAGIDLLPHINSVPFTFTITGVIEWYALTRLGLFKAIPVARDQLIEQMQDGIVVFDANRLIADVNPAAMRLTGASGNCIGKTADDAFPRQASTIAALRAQLFSGADRASVRAEFAPGSAVETIASVVMGPDGRRLATLVTLRDVTEQTRAEAELKTRSDQLAAALERSRTILAEMTDGVLLADEDGRLLLCNPAASRILELSGDVEGKLLTELLPAMNVAALVAEAGDGHGPAFDDVSLPDGRNLIVEAIPLPHVGEHGARTLLVISDETQRVAAERMQREFVANVAHELQTPLTGLSLLADTIPRALLADPEAADGFIARLGVEVGRLVRMTSELMTLSQMEDARAEGDLPASDLSAIAKYAVADVRDHIASKEQALRVRITEGVSAAGDELGLRMIAGNLLMNATRYTESGGDIELRVHSELDDEEQRWAVLSVSDNGEGIPAGDLDHIFERFYRVDKARSRSTGGAGLGLSIVRSAVERLGGQISVESALGEGSTFTVRLPSAR